MKRSQVRAGGDVLSEGGRSLLKLLDRDAFCSSVLLATRLWATRQLRLSNRAQQSCNSSETFATYAKPTPAWNNLSRKATTDRVPHPLAWAQRRGLQCHSIIIKMTRSPCADAQGCSPASSYQAFAAVRLGLECPACSRRT